MNGPDETREVEPFWIDLGHWIMDGRFWSHLVCMGYKTRETSFVGSSSGVIDEFWWIDESTDRD